VIHVHDGSGQAVNVYRNGHYGAALLGYAPIGAATVALGFDAAGVGGAIGALGLAMLPDWDQRVPGLTHRGPTHTVQFAALLAVGVGTLGALVGYARPNTGLAGTLGLAILGSTIGGVTILSHIAADALTPMGVTPFGEDGRHISYAVCPADSTLGNYGLLAFGAIAAVLAYALGSGLHDALAG
jgi:inner membrane protein